MRSARNRASLFCFSPQTKNFLKTEQTQDWRGFGELAAVKSWAEFVTNCHHLSLIVTMGVMLICPQAARAATFLSFPYIAAGRGIPAANGGTRNAFYNKLSRRGQDKKKA